MEQSHLQWEIAGILFTGSTELDTQERPLFAIKVDGKTYSHISRLLAAYPCLQQPDAAGISARILLFLHKGEQNRVITDTDGFRQSYKSRLLQEQLNEKLTPLYRQHPVFDVSRIQPPQWQNRVLGFFFIEHNSRLPYYVSYEFQAADAPKEQASMPGKQAHEASGLQCRLLAAV
ncbi:hypothetical protein SG34_015420 [Thalassomonas viridans]|uniref:Uncharacterized protein n=1 Tax=Thalassomonas viridans TaxID=137584 RepID=A0AAF0C7G7_9GAMM|nr:hypothetical protein [Thalassomonas viridans]WDE02834.1 hypothetical protein SG34_015420 [Thalassomonas viridans]